MFVLREFQAHHGPCPAFSPLIFFPPRSAGLRNANCQNICYSHISWQFSSWAMALEIQELKTMTFTSRMQNKLHLLSLWIKVFCKAQGWSFSLCVSQSPVNPNHIAETISLIFNLLLLSMCKDWCNYSPLYSASVPRVPLCC